MIIPQYIRVMARYNGEMNRRIYAAAAGLSDEQRREDVGIFWKSLHGTLCHLLWGDRQWMSRLDDWPPNTLPNPQSPTLIRDFKPTAALIIASPGVAGREEIDRINGYVMTTLKQCNLASDAVVTDPLSLDPAKDVAVFQARNARIKSDLLFQYTAVAVTRSVSMKVITLRGQLTDRKNKMLWRGTFMDYSMVSLAQDLVERGIIGPCKTDGWAIYFGPKTN